MVGDKLDEYKAILVNNLGHAIDRKEINSSIIEPEHYSGIWLETAGDLSEDLLKIISVKIIYDIGFDKLRENLSIFKYYAGSLNLPLYVASKLDTIVHISILLENYNQCNYWGDKLSDNVKDYLLSSYEYMESLDIFNFNCVEVYYT